MNASTHFIQQQTITILEQQKRAWDLFLYWMDQADDDVLTPQKKREFLDCLGEDRREGAGPVLLKFPSKSDSPASASQETRPPQCG